MIKESDKSVVGGRLVGGNTVMVVVLVEEVEEVEEEDLHRDT